MKRTAFPSFCLTCGYGQVPGESFNRHECRDFQALTPSQRQANADAHRAEIARRLAKP